MIAWIDGVMVTGSPEEIQRFREIAAKKTTTTDFFKTPVNDVPEHVKKYGNSKGWSINSTETHRVWF